MGLTEIKAKFYSIRSSCKIVVSSHACFAHPKRKFSNLEILNLVKYGSGQVKENIFSTAIIGSFLYCPKDDQNEACELVLLMEESEIETENGTTTETIIVCSAFRKDRA